MAFALSLAMSAGSLGCGGSAPPALRFETTEDNLRASEAGEEYDDTREGFLEDEALDAYVSAMGERVYAAITRPRGGVHFRVVDEAQPNAFALADGSVLITRGLLVLMNDEDELACLLAHEIAHAERRHWARPLATSSPVSPILGPWRWAGERPSYTREMEEEADFLGQQLCAAAGHDPMGMSTLLRSLRQVERIQFGFSRLPSFLVTHPGAQDRARTTAARASQMDWRRDPRLGEPRATLLEHIEGIDVGQRPQSGIFLDHRFVDPVLDYQITFPRDWVHSANNRVVGARSPGTGAIVFVTADRPAGDPQTRAEEWFAALPGNEIRVETSRPIAVGRMPAWRLELATGGRLSRTTGSATFVSHAGRTFRLIAAAPTRQAQPELRRAISAIRSFRPLNPENRARIEATRLRVVSAEAGESLADLGTRSGDSWISTRRAVMNGLFSDHVFDGGELVKIARREPYPTANSD